MQNVINLLSATTIYSTLRNKHSTSYAYVAFRGGTRNFCLGVKIFKGRLGGRETPITLTK